MLKLVALFLTVASPTYAASSLESLRQSGAKLQNGIERQGFAQITGVSERDYALRLVRQAADKAYRADSDLQMLELTAKEIQDLLKFLLHRPEDVVSRDRAELQLKFTRDALPLQNDAMSFVMQTVIQVKHQFPKPDDSEFIAAIREMDGRVQAADEAGKKLHALIEAIEAEIQSIPASDKNVRVKWLSGHLAADAKKYLDYSAQAREMSRQLAARLPPNS